MSRRSLLTSGLAGGPLLAFHLPVRAFNEPVQAPDDATGKFTPSSLCLFNTKKFIIDAVCW